MGTYKLGSRPETFTKVVKFQEIDGESAIEMVYIYRTRTEYGDFVDAWRKEREEQSAAEMKAKLEEHDAAVKAAKEAGQPEPALQLLSQSELQAHLVDASAEYILQIAKGWNLGVAFTRENIRQFCNETAAGHAAIVDTYRNALTEGRLGN